MMAEVPARPLTIYLVVGEASGDALGADLIEQMRAAGSIIRPVGLAGPRMREHGMESLFDISDIAVMGFAAVAGRLPRIMRRIGQTADDIIAQRPDMLLLIDSPEFAGRVAQRVRAKMPAMPIVKYICPSVWAWRPGRAPKMKAYLDHILAILPFEPELMERLGGPPASYIGHPLAWTLRDHARPARPKDAPKTLLLLPGSRQSEVSLLLPRIGKTMAILAERGNDWRFVLPAVDHLADRIEAQTADWPVKVEVVRGGAAKQEAFDAADAALAASGTVLLELALQRIPMISIYQLDWLLFRFQFLITGWTAALPNLIVDEAIVPERFNDMFRPGWVARKLEQLMDADSLDRRIQLEGFERVSTAMRRDEPPGQTAARILLDMLDGKNPA